MLAIANFKEAEYMELHELIQTTAALSGLICLIHVLFMIKKQLKEYIL